MELQNNELRIGNYIKFHNTITKVEGFSIWDNLIQSDNFAERELKDFEPIPLTEEWLLKFGIDFTSEKEWYQLTFTIKGLLFETASSMEGFTYNLCFDNMINIKYVHQLQNIYFCLCGEELTIKENE